MYRTLIAAALLMIAAPASAQMSHAGNYDNHEHAEHDHADAAHSDHSDQAMAEMDHGLLLADQADIRSAINAGGEPIVAKVLGAVCDFCAKAMNKSFGKRDEVAAVYVDLDLKTLSVVLKPGASMSDETVKKIVKKAGYKVDVIARGDAVIGS